MLIIYILACVAWAYYLSKDFSQLKNWQWLLSWTVFLPVVAVTLAWGVVMGFVEWLGRER